MATRGYNPKRIFYYPPVDPDAPLIDLYGDKDANNDIANRGSSPDDGAVSGPIGFSAEPHAIIKRSHGTTHSKGVINLGSDASIDNVNTITIIFDDFEIFSAGPASTGRIFDKGQYYSFYSGTEMRLVGIFSDGLATWKFEDIKTNMRGQLIITWNRSVATNDPAVYLNGVSTTVSKLVSRTGTPVSDAGNTLYLANNSAPAGIRSGDFEFSRFRLYNSVLSVAQIESKYKEYALSNPVRPTPRDEYPTTGVLAAPNHVGPWDTWAGSHSWLDDGSNRYILHDTNDDYTSIRSDQSRGFWYMRGWRASASAWIAFAFSMSNPDLRYTTSPQSGYFVQVTSNQVRLYESSSGALTQLFNNSLGATTGEVEIAISHRKSDGFFTVYKRDSTLGIWTIAGTATDTTHTTSRYFQAFSVISTDDIRIYDDLLFFPYGDTLTPNDIPIIAD